MCPVVYTLFYIHFSKWNEYKICSKLNREWRKFKSIFFKGIILMTCPKVENFLSLKAGLIFSHLSHFLCLPLTLHIEHKHRSFQCITKSLSHPDSFEDNNSFDSINSDFSHRLLWFHQILTFLLISHTTSHHCLIISHTKW